MAEFPNQSRPVPNLRRVKFVQFIYIKIWNALQKTYAHFDAEDSWQALLDSLELFRLLSLETASRLDFSYPIKIEQNATQLITRLYNGKSLEE